MQKNPNSVASCKSITLNRYNWASSKEHLPLSRRYSVKTNIKTTLYAILVYNELMQTVKYIEY